jgi:hypothetical protein
MGKSYRRPYAAVTGVRSAAHDKMVARRCWRRAQNQAIRDCKDWEELVMPKRLEASFNEEYGWVRDGKQTYQGYRWANLDNYFYMSNYIPEERLLEHFEDRLARWEEWQRMIRRK